MQGISHVLFFLCEGLKGDQSIKLIELVLKFYRGKNTVVLEGTVISLYFH